ncbi:MAG: hypothetical protein F6J90_22750 [Moorea sp. SIOASIH]|nr:hypothetical protein [Moorena sp. SIOASIH]
MSTAITSGDEKRCVPVAEALPNRIPKSQSCRSSTRNAQARSKSAPCRAERII